MGFCFRRHELLVKVTEFRLISQKPEISTKAVYNLTIEAAKAYPNNASIQDSCCDVFDELLYLRKSYHLAPQQKWAKKGQEPI